MAKLPITIDVHREPIPSPTHPIINQWLVDGRTEHAETEINVSVKDYGGMGDTISAVLGHELGHAEYQSMMSVEEFANLKRANVDPFGWEVMAWLRWAGGAGVIPISIRQARFILDALNTYRRGYNVEEGRWIEARRMVESWVHDGRTEVEDYEPLEPLENAPPPKGCMLEVGWGIPTTETDSKDSENDADSPDGEEVPKPQPIDRTARNAWLHSGEGMQAAAEGMGKLQTKLLAHGWDMEYLPPITLALLGK